VSTYTPIASQTLSSAAASVTFSGIPQTYTDLVVVVNATNSSGGDNAVALRFNGDTGSNYSMTRISGDGTSASSERNSNSTLMYLGLSNSTVYNSDIYHIMNYSNTTTNKTVLGRGNVANSRVRASVGLWRNTAAITSVTVINDASVNFASGSTFNLYGIASGGPKAFGGDTVTTDGTYYYHTFLSSGTFTPTQNLTCDYLVVAGGGSGRSGGGGAGGLRSTVTATGGGGTLETAISMAYNTAFTVTVGAGGAAGVYSAGSGSNGNASSISGAGITTISTVGGGRGGGYGGSNGDTGGSGGGGGGASAGGGTGGARTVNEGYVGGNGAGQDTSGGGGGAGAAGTNATSGNGASGVGGNGVAVSISGSSVTYAGGGGGCRYNGSGANGGSGGGGAGATSLNGNGTSGTANTGSGGGGYQNANSGAGGSGIVIIRYAI
jgi:hypothetical protein